MTISYVTSGPWGAGTGAFLPAATIDNNFWSLQTSINTLQSDMSTAVVSISAISVTGNQMYITLTNGAVQGPFTLPTGTWHWRGPWAPSTSYTVSDIVQYGIWLYLVTFAHTSAAVFDPGATDGSGHSYYQPILSIQQAAPVQSFVPGDSSGRWSSGNLWTPTVVDAGFYNRFPVNTPPSQIVIAVPPFSAVAFPVATEMHFRQAGTTGLFVQPQGGVQVVTPQGLLQMTDRFGATFTLKNMAQDLWELFGYLEPGSP